MLRYNPLLRGKVFRVIAAFERADQTERQRLTDWLTDRVLVNARQTRYGRGRGQRYSDWPVLSNTSLRDAPEDFCNRGIVRIPAATGGTSGLPIKLWRSLACLVAEQVFLDHMIRAHAMTWAGARIVSLRPHATKSTTDWSPPFGIKTHRGRRLVLSSPHLTMTTLPWFVDKIISFRPQIIWTTPTMMANLLHLLHQSRSPFQVPAPVILSSSARLEPGLRQIMEREWGAHVFDYYGQAERACFAVSERTGQFWFNPAYGRVELATSAADELTDGNRHVAIIATGYWNSAMPLVRYDTGDRAIVPANIDAGDLQAIALGLKPFLGIAGRSDEFLLTSENTLIGGLNCIPWEVDNLLQSQIVQEAFDSVVIRALVRPEFGPADRARLVANARAKIPCSMALRLEVVEQLQRGSHGKTPFVIRQIGRAPQRCAATATGFTVA